VEVADWKKVFKYIDTYGMTPFSFQGVSTALKAIYILRLPPSKPPNGNAKNIELIITTNAVIGSI
jgi:hypothetical protein